MDIFMVNRIDAWTRGRLEGMADAAGESKEIIKVNTRLIELEKSNAEANRMWREAVAEIERMKIDTEIRIKQETAAERERLSLARIAYENKLADLQQKEKDAEAARKADEMKAQLARDKQLEEAEKPVLIKRCQEPETRTTLAPFLDKGMVRPSGNRGTRYYDTIEPVPVSLKDLYAQALWMRLQRVSTSFTGRPSIRRTPCVPVGDGASSGAQRRPCGKSSSKRKSF